MGGGIAEAGGSAGRVLRCREPGDLVQLRIPLPLTLQPRVRAKFRARFGDRHNQDPATSGAGVESLQHHRLVGKAKFDRARSAPELKVTLNPPIGTLDPC